MTAVRRGRCPASKRVRILALGVEMPRCLVLGAIALEGPKTLILAPTALKSRPQDTRRGPVFERDDLGHLQVLKSTEAAQPGPLRQDLIALQDPGCR